MKTTVFLDTNVLIAFAQREGGAADLLSEPMRSRYTYVVNGVVLQELLLRRPPQDVDAICKQVDLRNVGTIDAGPLLQKLQELRNFAVHANDVLILGTAKECDLLVTNDVHLLHAARSTGLRALTLGDFLREAGVEP